MSNTLGGTTGGTTTGPTQITGSLGIETPIKIQNIITKDGKGHDVIIPLHTYIDDGKITINNIEKINTGVQDPIYTSTSVSLSEFVIGIAKDIFYSRDLSRAKSKTLAQDALYCAEIFTKILLSKKIISNKNGIVFYNDEYVPSATIKESQKLEVKVDKSILEGKKTTLTVSGVKTSVSIELDESITPTPDGTKLVVNPLNPNKAIITAGAAGQINIKVTAKESSKYDEAVVDVKITVNGERPS